MSNSVPTSLLPASLADKLLLLLVLPAGILGAVLLGGQQPMLPIAAAIALAAGYTVMTRPDVATYIVAFILYSNAATVAVHFHGVPYVVGASFSLLLLMPLGYYIIVCGEKLIVTPILVLMFFFGLVQMIGAVMAVHPELAVADMAEYLTEGIGLYFLMVNVIRSPLVLRRVICVMLVAGVCMGGLSLYQNVTGTHDNNYGGFAQVAAIDRIRAMEASTGEEHAKRVGGPVGGPNTFSRIMLMLFPLGMYLLWTARSAMGRVLAVVAIAAILAGAALTQSRGAVVGSVLMLLFMGGMGYIQLRRIAVMGAALAMVVTMSPAFQERLNTLFDIAPAIASDDRDDIKGTDASTKSRLTEMAAAGLVFVDHPFIGVGPGNFRYYYREYAEKVGLHVKAGTRQSHCLYVGMAAETGMIGVSLFAMVIFLTLRNLARLRKRYLNSRPDLAHLATALMMVVLLYLTTGIFDDYGYIRYFWLMISLASAAVHAAQKSTLMKPDHAPNALEKSYS